jgi:2'-5' RNA ligase
MTTQYAIVAFPEFAEPNAVEAVRRAFDPQATLLPAHITIVFPFVAPRSGAVLRDHIASCIVRVSCFDVMLAPPSPADDGYLFLRVSSGRDRIIDLHHRFYSGPLESELSTSRPYEPHITVGRLHSPEALASALVTARAQLPTPLHACIHRVHLFCIEASGGRVELSLPLVNSGAPRSSSEPAAPNER